MMKGVAAAFEVMASLCLSINEGGWTVVHMLLFQNTDSGLFL